MAIILKEGKVMVKDRKKYDLSSLLCAVMLSAEFLVTPITYFFGMNDNANLFILIIEFLLFLFLILFDIKSIKFHMATIFLMVFVSLFYMISLVLSSTNLSIIQYVFYFIVPLIVIGFDINFENVLKNMCYISLISLFCLNQYFVIEYSSLSQASMGSSYSVATICSAIIVHFMFYRKKTNVFIWTSYVLFFFLMFKLFEYGNRGAVIVPFIALFISLYVKGVIKYKKIFKFIVFVLFILILVALYNYQNVIENIYNFYVNNNYSVPSFLYKFHVLVLESNFDNNRTALYELVLSCIKKSSFFGYGLDNFGSVSNYNYSWTHNFVLQYIIDGGIIFAFILLLYVLNPLIYFVKAIQNKHIDNIIIFCIFIFSVSLFRFSVSNDPWLSTIFNSLLGFSSVLLDKYTKSNSNRNKLQCFELDYGKKLKEES